MERVCRRGQRARRLGDVVAGFWEVSLSRALWRLWGWRVNGGGVVWPSRIARRSIPTDEIKGLADGEMVP